MGVKARIGRFFTFLGERLADGDDHKNTSLEEAALFRSILHSINQVIWVDTLDKTQSILNIGDYANIYDRPSENLKSNPLDWMNAIHPLDRPRVEASLYKQKLGEFDEKYRVIHKDGAVKWLRDRSFIIYKNDGSPLYLSGIVTDITGRVELEERSRQDQKMKAIGALAGGICHDFNNVLAVVQGNIELSLSSDLPPRVAASLDMAFRACLRGATLTHRLLAYSRKQPLSPTAVEPAALINDLDQLLKRSLSEAIELEIVSGAGLWLCEADRIELETVILNLAINAQHATQGKGKLTLDVYNARIDDEYALAHDEVATGQYVCFAVTDNGVGMADDVAQQAFDPFFTTKEVGEGSGLGLSMAYGFAKQSGGHIKIYSEIGKGTTVKLYLPRSIDDKVGRLSRPVDLNAGRLAGKSVLILDNDDEVRKSVEAQMQSFGCRTVSVGSAEEALTTIASGAKFDLLLVDVVLGGGVTGPELASQIATEIPGVKILFMSGFTENAIVHNGKLDRGVALVQKPFTNEQLASACLRVLG